MKLGDGYCHEFRGQRNLWDSWDVGMTEAVAAGDKTWKLVLAG